MCGQTTLQKEATKQKDVTKQTGQQNTTKQNQNKVSMSRSTQENQMNAVKKTEVKERFFQGSITDEFSVLQEICREASRKADEAKDDLQPGNNMSADSYVGREVTTAIETLKRLDHKYKDITLKKSMPEDVNDSKGFTEYILDKKERNVIKEAKNLEMNIQDSEKIQNILKKADEQCAKLLGKAYQRENDMLHTGYNAPSKEAKENLRKLEEEIQVDAAVLSALWSNQYQDLYYGKKQKDPNNVKKTIRVGGIKQIEAFAESTKFSKERNFSPKKIKERKDYKEAEDSTTIERQYEHVFNIYKKMREKGNEINGVNSGVQNNSLLDSKQVITYKLGDKTKKKFEWDPAKIKEKCNVNYLEGKKYLPQINENSEERKALLNFNNATAEELKKALEAPAKGCLDFASASSENLRDYIGNISLCMQEEIIKFCLAKYDIEKNERNMKALSAALQKSLDATIYRFGDVKELVLEDAHEDVFRNLDISDFTQSVAVKQMQNMCDYIDNLIKKKNTVDKVKEEKNEYEKIKALFSAVYKLGIPLTENMRYADGDKLMSGAVELAEITNNLVEITRDPKIDLTEKGLKKIEECEKRAFTFLEQKVTETLQKNGLKLSNWEDYLNDSIKDKEIQETLNKNEQLTVYVSLYGAITKLREGAEVYKALMEKMAEKDFGLRYYNDVKEVRENLRNCSEKLQNSTMNEEEKNLAEEIQSYKAKLKKLRDQADPTEDKQKTEDELIAEGKVVFDTLREYSGLIYSIQRKVKNGGILLERTQARKLVDTAYDIKLDYVNRVFEEKKEILAYYEGSLILKNMPESKSYKNVDATKKIVEIEKYYKNFREECRVYFNRYASVEGTSYYVGKVKAQYEFVSHKIRKAMGTTAEALFKNLDDETKKKITAPLTEIDYGDKERNLYQTLMKDNQVVENLPIGDYPVEQIMSTVYNFALTQKTFDNAGMKGADIIRDSFGYTDVPTNILDKSSLNDRMVQVLKKTNQEELKNWFADKAKNLVDNFLEVQDKYTRSLEGTKNSTENEMYFLSQTQLGTQLQVLAAIGRSLGFEELANNAAISRLYILMGTIHNSCQHVKNLIGGEDISKMQEEAGWETYVRMYQQTGLEKQKRAKEAEDAYKKREEKLKASLESAELKAAIDGVRSVEDGKATEEFRAVSAQLNLIMAIEMGDYTDPDIKKYTSDEFKAKKIANEIGDYKVESIGDGENPYLNITKKEDVDYLFMAEVRNKAYKELFVLVRSYITKKGTRGAWLRSGRGIRRLNAMKNLFGALKTYYGLNAELKDTGEVKDALDKSSKVKNIVKEIDECRTEKTKVSSELQALANDENIAKANEDKLAELKKRYETADENKKKLTLEEFYSSNEGLFGRMLLQKQKDLFVNAGYGANFYKDLKSLETQLKNDKVKEVWKEAKTLKRKCYKQDLSQMSEMERFDVWAECQEFIEKYSSEHNPIEAQKILKEIKVLSENYVSQKEYEKLLSEMDEDRERVKKYATDSKGTYAYKDKYGETREREADMLFLVYKYKMFLKGAGKLANQEKLSKEEKEDKDKKFSEFKTHILLIEKRLNNDVFKDDKNKVVKTAVMKEARRNLDKRLARVRTLLDNNDFLQDDKRLDQKLRPALKDATEELNFYLDTFADLKTKNGQKKTVWMYITGQEPAVDFEATDMMEYYSAQRDNLRKLLAYSAIDAMVYEDYDALDIKDQADARMKKLQDHMESSKDKEGKISAKHAQSSKQIEECLKFILDVEVESKKLGGVKKLGETQPEMAAELRKQLEFGAEYEDTLKGLGKKEMLHEAMNNMAGDYLTALETHMQNVDSSLSMEGERMNYYYLGFTNAYDKASEFLRLLYKWDSGYESGNSKKLKKIVQKIDKNTKDVMALYNFKEEDSVIRDSVETLKIDKIKGIYATDKVVKQRDFDFATTMRNLANIRLGSGDDLKINKEIKDLGVKYNQKGYKDMKVRNDFYLKDSLFGHVWWGTETYSLDELINNLYEETYMDQEAFDEAEPLLEQLMDLKRMAMIMTNKEFRTEDRDKLHAEIKKEKEKVDEKTEAKIDAKTTRNLNYTPGTFKSHVEDLNRTVETTYMILHDKIHKMDDDQKLAKKYTKFSESFYDAWKSYYPSLQKLSEQMEGYIDRTQDNKRLKEQVKTVNRMIRADKSNLSDEQKERAYLRVFNSIPKIEYAESREEYASNVQFLHMKQKCIRWFENYSFKKAQEVAQKFRDLSSGNGTTEKYACIAEYYDFMGTIELYYMQGAIDEKIYNSTKTLVEREMSKRGEQPLSAERLAKRRADFQVLNQLDTFMDNLEYIDQMIEEHKQKGEPYDSPEALKVELQALVKQYTEVLESKEIQDQQREEGIAHSKEVMGRYKKFAGYVTNVMNDNRDSDAQVTVKSELKKKETELKMQGYKGKDLQQKLDEWLQDDDINRAIMGLKFRWWRFTDWKQKLGSVFSLD